jgi:predicted ribosomally synthesized peptide with SipW-like signal peptide
LLKKIIGLGLAGIVLLSLAATGTWAFFQDSEAGSGNTMTSGTLDLQVGTQDPMSEKIEIDNIQPGNNGNTASWPVHNSGSISGSFYLSVGEVSNAENGRSEVESASGDLSDDQGEMGGLLTLALWMDNGAGGWSSGDYYLDPSGSGLDKITWSGGSSLPSGAYFSVDTFSGKSSSVLQNISAGSTPGNFKVDFVFPDSGSGDNRAQSDNCSFDLVFSLNQ